MNDISKYCIAKMRVGMRRRETHISIHIQVEISGREISPHLCAVNRDIQVFLITNDMDVVPQIIIEETAGFNCITIY